MKRSKSTVFHQDIDGALYFNDKQCYCELNATNVIPGFWNTKSSVSLKNRLAFLDNTLGICDILTKTLVSGKTDRTNGTITPNPNTPPRLTRSRGNASVPPTISSRVVTPPTTTIEGATTSGVAGEGVRIGEEVAGVELAPDSDGARIDDFDQELRFIFCLCLKFCFISIILNVFSVYKILRMKSMFPDSFSARVSES